MAAPLAVPDSARGERLDLFLSAQLPALSRSRLQALIASGAITVDGKPAKPALRLKGGEAVEVRLPAVEPATPVAQDLPLKVIYDDADILVLDKAAGMVVHPGAGNRDGTLVNALLFHVSDLRGVGGELRPGIVHRLDKDTSGLLVVAKHDQALGALQKAFAAREVHKLYLALVKGVPPSPHSVRTLYGRHPTQRLKFSGRVKRGKSAVTHWVVQRAFAQAALLEVTLETGRTHQIRAHLSEAGHPLLGDALYGGAAKGLPKVIARQALHAWRLAFAHPRTGQALRFEAPPPADFSQAMVLLEGATAPRGR